MQPTNQNKLTLEASLDSLREQLDSHNKWLGETKGGSEPKLYKGEHQCADLSFHNFEGIPLKDRNLAHADLTGTSFKDATLHRTSFENAKLAGVNFGGADITGVKFDTDPFEGKLKIVEETSKIARSLFLTLLTLLAFIGLTLAATNNSQLFVNSSNFHLPIIQTSISIQEFYYVAPLVLFGVYLYFH